MLLIIISTDVSYIINTNMQISSDIHYDNNNIMELLKSDIIYNNY